MNARYAVSVVIPAFNEAARLGASLRQAGEFFSRTHLAAEVIVVDDGSRDDTAGVARDAAGRFPVPVRVLRYTRNRGKGFAVKQGVAAAGGARILVSDADFSTPIDELERFMARMDEGDALVIGSRNLPDSRIETPQPRHRIVIGCANTWLVRRVAARVSDATCGFKLFEGAAGRDIFSRVRVPGFGFDAEVLFLAGRLGYSVREEAVIWNDKPGSRISVLRDTLDTLVGLASIRVNALKGRYRQSWSGNCETESWSSPPVVGGHDWQV